MSRPLLELSGVSMSIGDGDGGRAILRDVSLSVAKGEVLGLVGESGSGKSMTARAITRLLPDAAAVTGTVSFDGRSVRDLDRRALRAFRQQDVATIFQDPRASINPVHTVGDFLTESLRVVGGIAPRQAEQRAVDMLDEVGIADGRSRMQQYPHELSGGLLQRVMIASVLLTEPKLIIADEPTTALDVTTQEEVVAILAELTAKRGLAMLFITHDLELATAICDRICVMYAGSIVETQAASAIQSEPAHPYTRALFEARPRIDETVSRLTAIPGRPIAAYEAPTGCAFADRCAHCRDECLVDLPAMLPPRPESAAEVRCVRADELLLEARDA